MSAVINSEFQEIFFNLMYVILNFAEGFIQSFCIPVFFKYFLILKNVSVWNTDLWHSPQTKMSKSSFFEP